MLKSKYNYPKDNVTLKFDLIKTTGSYCRVSLLSQLPALRPFRTKTSVNPRYSLTWDQYHPHDTINEFLDELDASHDFVRP
jgi:hypothetical protein